LATSRHLTRDHITATPKVQSLTVLTLSNSEDGCFGAIIMTQVVCSLTTSGRQEQPVPDDETRHGQSLIVCCAAVWSAILATV